MPFACLCVYIYMAMFLIGKAKMDLSEKTNYPLAKGNGDESFAYAIQLVLGIGLPTTMHAAIELGIFEIMAKSGDDAKLSASQIAAQMMSTGSHNPNAPAMLYRILRLLASHNVVTCSLVGPETVYGLTPVAKHFVADQDGRSLGPLMALTHDKVFLDSWSQLKEAVAEGVPFERMHRKNVFEYLESDPRLNKMFNAAMINQSTIVIRNMLEVYKGFDHIEQLVDIGGGLGVTIKAITSKYPHINGINFDLPHVIQHAPHHHLGVENVSGNMLESVPKGDVIFLKWILHDWSDEYCLRLLKNCYKSIPDDGKVVVMENIAPAMAETTEMAKAVFLSDILMMTQSPGGKERTQDEFMALATAAGFCGIKLVCSVCNFWVMEF